MVGLFSSCYSVSLTKNRIIKFKVKLKECQIILKYLWPQGKPFREKIYNSMIFPAFLLGDKNLWLVINELSVWSLVYVGANKFDELIILGFSEKW